MSKEKVPLPDPIGYDSIIIQIKMISKNQTSLNDKLIKICELLKAEVTYYDWVGFYFVDKYKEDELILGPFAGEPTEHPKITFGKGVCGQVAEQRKTIIVQDVSKDKNYLTCNINVKSEIVVPILKSGNIIGEIDIDSYKPSAFSDADKKFLEKVAKITKELL